MHQVLRVLPRPTAAGACAYFYSSYLEAQAIDLAMARDAATNMPRVTITGRNLPLDAGQYTITVNSGDQPVSDVVVSVRARQLQGAAAWAEACGLVPAAGALTASRQSPQAYPLNADVTVLSFAAPDLPAGLYPLAIRIPGKGLVAAPASYASNTMTLSEPPCCTPAATSTLAHVSRCHATSARIFLNLASFRRGSWGPQAHPCGGSRGAGPPAGSEILHLPTNNP
jgi:hypothetical protein